jgi:hypothetical protein
MSRRPWQRQENVGNTNGFSGLNNATYIRAKLKRDDKFGNLCPC